MQKLFLLVLRYAICLALICVTAISTVSIASAQAYTGSLELDGISPNIKTGSTVVFSGQLTTTSGYVVPDATIYIKDNVRLGRDDIIKRTTTDGNGEFYTTWTAQERSSGAWDFYAEFEGSHDVSKARSAQYSVKVSPSHSGSSSYNSPSGGSSSGSKQPTSLVLDDIPTRTYAGDTVTFTGKLTSNGQSLRGATIEIKEDDPGWKDQTLGYGMTDSNGRFSIAWSVDAGLIETDFDIYAEFDGASGYEKARSYNQEMGVYKRGGSIHLDPLPDSARTGDILVFSGTLKLDGYNPNGAVVYIKDEDTGSRDDLLATGFADRYGRFSANWLVRDVDPGNNHEIYAVFEGTDIFERLTTNIKDLKVLEPRPRTPPDSGQTGRDEYMEFRYSLDFSRTPKVTIVPDPKSFDIVRGHITPVAEGIRMWQGYMEHKYGGDWSVDFELVRPNQGFVSSNPDVVVNLVAYDMKKDGSNGCDDYYGVAYNAKKQKPVNTVVCSINDGKIRSNEGVAATAAHEFIHAMGLGHTWNKKGDLMCSKEENVWTCGRSSQEKSKTPSNLNLAAVAKMYGTDGFTNPNYHVERGDRFSLTNPDHNSPNPSKSKPIPATHCEKIYDNYDWTITEKKLRPGWYTWWKICSGDISYSLATDDKRDGFMIFVLPPSTDVKSFMKDRDGRYYTCEEYEKTWHKKSGTCNIAPGSHIVLKNTEENTITIDGRIRNQ